MNDFLDLMLPMPCLFYPVIREMGMSVPEVLKDGRLQADVLTHIAEEFPVSAVVRMTELWCEAASFGMDIELQNDDFPHLGMPLCEEAEDLAALDFPPAVNPITKPLIDAVKLAVPKMKKPLIVGVTGPYTMSAVLNGSENFMMNCMTEEEDVHEFLKKAASFLIAYIREYKSAGARAVMIAEPSAAMISPDMMRTFSNDYVDKIIDAVQDDSFAVIYHNCGAVNRHLEAISELHAAAFHFGSDVDLVRARNIIDRSRIVMGNLDPRLFLTQTPSEIENQAKTLCQICRSESNTVISTGCDLSPAAKMDSVRAFLRASV